jgi:DNA polymerase-3 subunit delta'
LQDADLSGLHGDLHLIKKEKDKKNISIDQVRELIRKLNMSSFLNSYKVGIIKHAHSLSTEAANALLKILEEPKEKVIIILVTSDIDAMPTTIVSRSQILKFNPVGSDIIYDYLVKEHKASRSAAKKFSLLCLGRPALAVKFLEDKEFYNNYLERVNIFLNFLNQDINERFNAVEKLLNTGSARQALSGGQETAKLAGRIIEIWLGLSRDMLLLEFNRKDLIQHEITTNELLGVKEKLRLGSLLHLTDVLRKANGYLKANVNPKSVLEQVAINI